MWVERCVACGYEGGGTITLPLPEVAIGSRDVAGYFQLSDVAQLGVLRVILPDLAAVPLHALAERLRQQSFRWPVGSLFSYQAHAYQSQAAAHGFTFNIENDRSA
jgi:hypothetical protein